MWIKFLAWLIGRSGYTAVRTERWEAALSNAVALGNYVVKSGALNDRRLKTPRAVRKIDRLTAVICEHLRDTALGEGEYALLDEYIHQAFRAKSLELALASVSARLKAYEGGDPNGYIEEYASPAPSPSPSHG